MRLARHPGPLDRHLVGSSYIDSILKKRKVLAKKASKYLALHLRFEVDMVAHSLCDYGGGDEERKELEAYREIHFPALTELKKNKKYFLQICFIFLHLFFPSFLPVSAY